MSARFHFFTTWQITDPDKVIDSFHVIKSKRHSFRPHLSVTFKQIASPSLKHHLPLTSRSSHCPGLPPRPWQHFFRFLLAVHPIIRILGFPWLSLRPLLCSVVSPWVLSPCKTSIADSLLYTLVHTFNFLAQILLLTSDSCNYLLDSSVTCILSIYPIQSLLLKILVFFHFSFHPSYTLLWRP